MLDHWQVKKKKKPNKRRVKLEMVKNKQQKNQAPQTLSRWSNHPLYQNVLNSVPFSSSVQMALKSLRSVPWGTTNPYVREGKESNQSYILQAIIKMKITKQWKVFVLNEEEQDGIMGTIPSELLKTRWKHF